MANFDPIAQMLTVIRNGIQAKKKFVIIGSSNLKKILYESFTRRILSLNILSSSPLKKKIVSSKR